MGIRVYVGGPITKGDFMVNVRNALNAADALRKAGMFPYVPHAAGALWHLVHPLEYEDWMEQDFEWISVCQAMVRIPGESSGADREVAFCAEKKILVFYSVQECINWYKHGLVYAQGGK